MSENGFSMVEDLDTEYQQFLQENPESPVDQSEMEVCGVEIPRPKRGYQALFGELEFYGQKTSFKLSTQMHIAPGLLP
jgi:hypothetical protein